MTFSLIRSVDSVGLNVPPDRLVTETEIKCDQCPAAESFGPNAKRRGRVALTGPAAASYEYELLPHDEPTITHNPDGVRIPTSTVRVFPL